jgi:protein-disulfide isomerase
MPQQSPALFWKFHDYVFSKQHSITSSPLRRVIDDFLSATPEVNKEEYNNYIESAFPQNRLEQDLAVVRDLRIHATPVVFLNGRRYEGFRDEASFISAIDLAGKNDTQREVTK